MVPAVPPSVTAHRTAARHPARTYFRNIRNAVTSTFEGMSVTMSWMFRRPATIQYPDKTAKPVQEMLPDGYRGILEVDLDRCTACLLCQKACPLGCISIEVCKNPVTGGRDMSKFDIDIGLCMYCGLCAEACNFDAIDHTTEFEGTMTSADQLTLHFVKETRPVTKLKASEMAPRKPKGSILAKIIPAFGRRQPQLKKFPEPLPARTPAPAAAAAPAGTPAAAPVAPAAAVAPTPPPVAPVAAGTPAASPAGAASANPAPKPVTASAPAPEPPADAAPKKPEEATKPDPGAPEAGATS